MQTWPPWTTAPFHSNSTTHSNLKTFVCFAAQHWETLCKQTHVDSCYWKWSCFKHVSEACKQTLTAAAPQLMFFTLKRLRSAVTQHKHLMGSYTHIYPLLSLNLLCNIDIFDQFSWMVGVWMIFKSPPVWWDTDQKTLHAILLKRKMMFNKKGTQTQQSEGWLIELWHYYKHDLKNKTCNK